MSEETKFKSTALWEYTEQITLQPTESTTITVPSTIKTAAKALYFTQRLLKNGASEYQYNVKSCISCKIIYKSSKVLQMILNVRPLSWIVKPLTFSQKMTLGL